MEFSRIALAALGGTVASFVVGLLLMWLMPALIRESNKYPAIYRNETQMKPVMPVVLIGTYLAVLLATVLFAQIPHAEGTLPAGLHFGILIGLFVVCGFVLHNFVTLNIAFKLTSMQAVAYFVQWLVIGIVIALIYKPTLGL